MTRCWSPLIGRGTTKSIVISTLNSGGNSSNLQSQGFSNLGWANHTFFPDVFLPTSIGIFGSPKEGPNRHEILSVYGDVATPSMPFMALSAEHSNSCNKKSAWNGLLDEFSACFMWCFMWFVAISCYFMLFRGVFWTWEELRRKRPVLSLSCGGGNLRHTDTTTSSSTTATSTSSTATTYSCLQQTWGKDRKGGFK